MRYKIFQVDAFADALFKGNPAAVVPLKEWLPDKVMQEIAAENNLAETAFYKGANGEFEIRWFSPEKEINLCGHATLASAFVINSQELEAFELLKFKSKGGDLLVKYENGEYTLDFPIANLQKIANPSWVVEYLGTSVIESYKAGEDLMFVLKSEKEVLGCDPDFKKLKEIVTRGFIITSSGDSVDFVSRFFAPAAGIDEDPATGSAHCALIPYWSKILGKKDLSAQQLSKRKGNFKCELLENRVLIGGGVKLFLEGEILID